MAMAQGSAQPTIGNLIAGESHGEALIVDEGSL